jgi:hypothetical protein
MKEPMSQTPSDPKQKTADTPVIEDEMPGVSDYQSIEFLIRIKNNTAGAVVPEEPPCRLVQFLEKGMVLEVPARSCSEGHNLSLEIKVKGLADPNFKFSGTAKIDELQSYLGDAEQITLTLVQFNEKEWKTLTGSMGQRQDDIMNFFNAAKGR